MESDLISRSKLLQRLQGVLAMVEGEPNQTYANAIRHAIIDVKLSPSAKAEPEKTGSWEIGRCRTSKSYIRRCTVCGQEFYFCGTGCSYRFCPICGIGMKEALNE